MPLLGRVQVLSNSFVARRLLCCSVAGAGTEQLSCCFDAALSLRGWVQVPSNSLVAPRLLSWLVVSKRGGPSSQVLLYPFGASTQGICCILSDRGTRNCKSSALGRCAAYGRRLEGRSFAGLIQGITHLTDADHCDGCFASGSDSLCT